MSETRLARNKNGDVIHLGTCRHARAPWLWAEKEWPWNVANAIRQQGYRLCGSCRPQDKYPMLADVWMAQGAS